VDLVNRVFAAVAILGIGCANPSVPLDSSATASTSTTGPAGPVTGPTGAGGAGTSSTVGTGGAPPVGTWQNVTSNLANMHSECGNLTSLTVKPDEDLLIAGVAQDGLWGSRDGGATWSAFGTAAGSAKITNRPTALVFDPANTSRFWESGIYNGGGVYMTQDDGVTFAQLGMVMHSDLVSVDLSDPAHKTLLAGGHEQTRTLNRSTDGGMTWTNVGAGLPDMTNCTLPLVLDANTFLVGCGGYGGGPVGVLRSEDGGATWTRVSTAGGGAPPLVASDGTIYWSTPGGGMVRSDDHGKTFTVTIGGGTISGARPAELPDGRIATLAGQVVATSSDRGVTWHQVTTTMTFTNSPTGSATGVTYSAKRKAFFVWYFSCADTVPPDGIQRYDFDYQTQ
jgi:hypothetical protein